ncbi:MAG: ParA family protein [Chloroflexi bacterium]|nr:ParA family protein [Chloroflexota bacterium]
MKIFAVGNHKGGVGKTTSAIHIASALRRFHGLRVLLVDTDPQANSTTTLLGVPRANGPMKPDEYCLHEVLREVDPVKAETAIVSVDMGDGTVIDVLPSHLRLMKSDKELQTRTFSERVLRDALHPLRDRYDVVILDTPPSLGQLVTNSLVAADFVIVPVTPGLYPIVGLSLLSRTIQEARQGNPRLQIGGVLPVMLTPDNTTRDSVLELRKNKQFGRFLMVDDNRKLIVVPKRVAITKMEVAAQKGKGRDLFVYEPKNDACGAYRRFAAALVARHKIVGQPELATA